ncbi:MAG: hypothetical protein ACYDHD_05095 [Vulcanimicrobiaceae bacterium]
MFHLRAQVVRSGSRCGACAITCKTLVLDVLREVEQRKVRVEQTPTWQQPLPKPSVKTRA